MSPGGWAPAAVPVGGLWVLSPGAGSASHALQLQVVVVDVAAAATPHRSVWACRFQCFCSIPNLGLQGLEREDGDRFQVRSTVERSG